MSKYAQGVATVKEVHNAEFLASLSTEPPTESVESTESAKKSKKKSKKK